MPALAIPLTLPVSTYPDRDWHVAKARDADHPYVLTIALLDLDEAQAVQSHLARFYGPAVKPQVP